MLIDVRPPVEVLNEARGPRYPLVSLMANLDDVVAQARRNDNPFSSEQKSFDLGELITNNVELLEFGRQLVFRGPCRGDIGHDP